MEYQFSQRAKASAISPIRAITAYAAGNPDFINLAQGNPATEAIAVDKITAQCAKVFENDPLYVLKYGPSAGMPQLQAQILERLSTVKGIDPTTGEVLILSGSQQGLDMMPRLFCNEGDVILCDEFTFSGALSPMRNLGAVTVGVEMDAGGMRPEALETAILANPNAKYIYLIPNFQNPTGITMDEERRRAIYAVAVKHNLPIYEDDPYGELIFEGTACPTIKSMDTHNLVIYAGSFSKTLAAGLRVGFLYAHPDIIQKATAVRVMMDAQSPMLSQYIVSNFLNAYDYDGEIEKIRTIYREKCQTMLAVLDAQLPASVVRTHPTGGMFVWLTFPDHVDCDALQEAFLAANLGVVPSSAFAANLDNPGKCFRVNYSAPTIALIQEGVKRLGAVAREFC